MRWLVLCILHLVVFQRVGSSQTLEDSKQLLYQIGEFEGRKDPKCAATANRLEDFMYGTRLEESARIRKSELQKALILSVWEEANSIERSQKSSQIYQSTLQQVLSKRVSITETDVEIQFNLEGNKETVTQRDFKHYSAVAYGYRAILSVQQDGLFNPDFNLLPLSGGASKALKEFVDQVTLVVLKIADRKSRKLESERISEDTFQDAWEVVTEKSAEYIDVKASSEAAYKQQIALVRSIIEKKKEAFQEYNHISMTLFQRNAQVYFSRHGWPKDEKENEAFRAAYNETLIQFIKDMWLYAAGLAKADEKPLIRLEHISEALEAYLPYEQNDLEDITFFPKLHRSRQIDVEAYDLDAFRDGGVHWTYIEMALDDGDFNPEIMPDPFALELLSEGIAHMGVLTLRIAGQMSKDKGHGRMTSDDFVAGLKVLQKLISDSGAQKDNPNVNPEIASSPESSSKEGVLFSDVSGSSGIQFEHRSADWVNRLIRSYRVTESNEAKISIPPAFGGAGVAAEDLNSDGWPDVLLLSGLGNKLFVNRKDGTFEDATKESGLDWKRPDKTYGEPRQPIIADFDNDGKQDVFISYVNDKHRIYRNIGGLKFEDMTKDCGLGGEQLVGGPATAIDFDKDGLLDIYIGYFGDYLNAVSPTLARKNKNGLPNKLFRNLGGFKFEEVKNAGVEDNGWTQSIGHSDINGDGWQDLISGNDFGTNTYYINNGDGTFSDKTRDLGTDKPSFTMNVGITDLNRDHKPDFYISNIVVMEKDEKYVDPKASTPMKFNLDVMANMRVVEANDLFISEMSEDGTDYSLSTDVSRGYSFTGWSWDADFFDYDNDGDQDLYCLTGMNDFFVYSTENPYYQDPDGVGRSVAFAESNREPNVFFENSGGKLLANQNESGLDVVYNSRSAAFLDFDLDGDEDILINNYHDEAVIFSNNSDKLDNNWIKLRLIGNPEKGITKDAIGARVIITASELDVWREVHSTTGYLSVHPKELHIGIGGNESVEMLILWPDGTEQRFEKVETNKRYLLSYQSELKTENIK